MRAGAAAPEQPESALTAIKVVFGLVPAAAAVLAMIVFITYPLTDQRFREVRDETEALTKSAGRNGGPRYGIEPIRRSPAGIT